MDDKEVLARVGAIRPRLREMGVATLYLFGSMARHEQHENSDIDLLVEFSAPIGLTGYIAILEELEAALGRRVDLVDVRTLRPPLGDRIRSEAIRAA